MYYSKDNDRNILLVILLTIAFIPALLPTISYGESYGEDGGNWAEPACSLPTSVLPASVLRADASQAPGSDFLRLVTAGSSSTAMQAAAEAAEPSTAVASVPVATDIAISVAANASTLVTADASEPVVADGSLATIEDGDVPLASFHDVMTLSEDQNQGDGWSLLNLMAMLLTLFLSIFLLADITYIEASTFARLLGIIPAAGSVTLFFVTEHLPAPVHMADAWTVSMLAVLMAEVVHFSTVSGSVLPFGASNRLK